MKAEVDAAPYTTSDPDIVKLAAEIAAAGPQTLSISLGYDDDEYLKAQEEQQRKADAMAQAQSKIAEAGGSPGSAPGSIKNAVDDPKAGKEARKGDVEEKKLQGESGQRGEGK